MKEQTAATPCGNGHESRRKRGYALVTDLPEPLPVTEAELELLERELSAFITALLQW